MLRHFFPFLFVVIGCPISILPHTKERSCEGVGDSATFFSLFLRHPNTHA